MKKVLTLVLAIVLCCSLFVSCSSASYTDGTYKAEMADFDEHGWKEYVTVTVSGGKITAVDYDAVNSEGALKSQDTAYREAMEPVSGTYPEKFMKELEDQFVSNPEVDQIEAVAGATNSTDSFKKLMKEVMEVGVKNGNTTTIVVEA